MIGGSGYAFHQEENASWNARLLPLARRNSRFAVLHYMRSKVARSTKRALDMSFLRAHTEG